MIKSWSGGGLSGPILGTKKYPSKLLLSSEFFGLKEVYFFNYSVSFLFLH